MFLIVEPTTNDRYSKKPAVFEPTGYSLKLLRDGGWMPETWLKDFISRRPRIGTETIVRAGGSERIIRGLMEVLPTEPRYLEAWRQEFLRAGFYADIVDEKRAKLCENIRGSGIDQKVQDEVVFGIHNLPDGAAEKIRKELENLPK